jgi:hypothetical protein
MTNLTDAEFLIYKSYSSDNQLVTWNYTNPLFLISKIDNVWQLSYALVDVAPNSYNVDPSDTSEDADLLRSLYNSGTIDVTIDLAETVNNALSQTVYSTTFSDVSLINIINNNVAPNFIVGAQDYGIYPQSFSLSSKVGSTDHHGDIWFVPSHNYSPSMQIILHEFGHSLGLKHPFDAPANEDIDSLKYTLMSYDSHPDMLPGVEVTGLQILDIAALQAIYGANYDKRSGDSSYTLAHMNPDFASDPDKAFLYTIWDGNGVDILDAATSSVSAEIDLRQGRFSSIGSNGDDTLHGFMYRGAGRTYGSAFAYAK